MKKFLLTVLFLLLLIVGGIGFFIVRSFNAENFHKQIIETVSKVTGREFNVMGETYITWFPSPEFVLSNVTLSNTKTSTRGVMLKIETISIQLTWQSLLKNPLVIDKIKVENPVLYLERNASNQVNWDFEFLTPKAIENSVLGLDNNFAQTKISNLEIQNGSLNYINEQTKSNLELANINGRVSMGSLQGPYNFNGTLVKKDTDFITALSVQQLNTDTPVPFSLSMKAKDKSFIIDLNGELLTHLKKGLDLTANGSFSVKKPNDLLKELDLKPLDASLNIPSEGSLTYSSQNGIDSLKNFTIRFGDTEDSVALNGSISREKKDNALFYTASLNINHLDYNQWTNFLNEINLNSLSNNTLPNFDLNATIQKLTYKKEIAKDISFSASKKENRIILHSLKALLAGDTTFQATGGSLAQNETTGFSLILNSESKNFKEILNPFFNTKNIQQNMLKSAKFNGNLIIWPKELEVDIQSFESEGAVATGKMQIIPGKKPTVNFEGSLKNINIDDLTGYKHSNEKKDLFLVLPAVKNYLQQASYLSKFNSKFNIDLKDITIHNLPILTGKLNGSLENNSLKITDFIATGAAMASLSASLDADKVASDTVALKNINIDFNTKELKLFLNRANLVSNNQFLNKENELFITLKASENNDTWTGDAKTRIGELKTDFSGSLTYQKNNLEAKNLLLNLTYPSFQKFLKNVVQTNKIHNALEGNFVLKGILNGSPSHFNISNSEIQIGLNSLKIDGKINNSEAEKSIDIQVKTPSIDMEKYILNEFRNLFAVGQVGNNSFDFSLLDLWQIKLKLDAGQILWKSNELRNALVDLSIQDKMLKLNNLSGTPSTQGSNLKMNGSISWSGVPHLKANVNLSGLEMNDNILSSTKASFGSGILTLEADINSTGKSPNEMRSNLSGKGKINILNPIWIGSDIQKITPLIQKSIKERTPKHTFDTELARYLNNGKTPLESLTGDFTISKGVLKMMDASLKAESFYSNPMQLIYTILNDTIDISVPISLTNYSDLPPFALTFRGKTSAPVFLTNYVDLSNSVEDIIQKDNTKIAEKLQKEQEKQEQLSLTEREEKIKQAISDAKEAVKSADQKLFAGDNESAAFLLQNAKDALSIVNQLSVKESLTDAQYIQLMEQSRLAILKAQEAVDEAVRDLYFEDRKQVQAFLAQAKEMQAQIVSLNKQKPEIEIVAKLLNPVRQYTDILTSINQQFTTQITEKEHAEFMEMAQDSFAKIVRAYEYTYRFADEETKYIEPLSVNRIPNKDILSNPENEPVETEIEDLPTKKNELQGTIQRN